MNQQTYQDIIKEQTDRALWEVKNVINCVPDANWSKIYCGMPLWKHIYHMLHSLDLWFINPRDPDYTEPDIHETNLNNLDVITQKELTRDQINVYSQRTIDKVLYYIEHLQDKNLLQKPSNCEYTSFTLILAQYRHLHSHLGMIMGFIIADTGMWPRVVGLESPIPTGDFDKYF